MNTFDAIKLRHSTRGFSDRQIPEQDLQDILVAGWQAAIGCADFDSLKLYAVQDPALLTEIDLASANGNPNAHPLYHAPTLIVVAAKKGFLENIELSNAGCIIQNMMVLAADREIDSVYLWMAMVGINGSEDVQKKLGFPEGYFCVGTCALGYAEKPFPKLKGDGQRLEVKFLR
jgi:nitroreductase